MNLICTFTRYSFKNQTGIRRTLHSDVSHARSAYVQRLVHSTFIIYLQKKNNNSLARVLFPVAAGSQAWVCARSLSGIAASNPAGGHGCLSLVSVVCCHVEIRDEPITRPEGSYRV
jgi:hypothetical protein